MYLSNGKHTLSVNFKCAVTSISKTLDIDVFGVPQEYKTDVDSFGLYRIWRVK